MSILLYLFIPVVWALNQGQIYDLTDLKKLAHENAHKEFLSHYLDPKPKLRDANWQALVEKMAINHYKWLSQDLNSLTEEDFKLADELINYPWLKKSPTFTYYRHLFGLKYFRQKLSEKSEQLSAKIHAFWVKDSGDPEMAKSYAELYRESGGESELWSFYGPLVKTEASFAYCKLPEVQTALKEKIYTLFLSMKYNYRELVSKVMHPNCWLEFKEKFKADFHKTPKQYLAETYLLLKAEKLIDEKEEDFFALNYLMSGPSLGETFNLSWNRLSVMRSKEEKRKEVMELIKKMPHLPDNILSDLDQKKTTVILSHVAKSLPEFLDHYAESCINYLSGKEKFSLGNPTINCRKLFDLNKAQGHAYLSKIIEYQYEQSLK